MAARLTVRPREMATGTVNPAAGDYPLDSPAGFVVYVPPACVGARRCPLVVFLPWGSADAQEVLHWQRPVGDKYGMIILTSTAPKLGFISDEELLNRTNLDHALQHVLRKFAVDPAKIALFGHCNSGAWALLWGGDNLDVFSRIGVLSSTMTTAGVDAPNGTAEFILDDDFLASEKMFVAARELRRMGRRVKHLVSLRQHPSHTENFDAIGHWLQESWAVPDPAARTAPLVIPGPLALLTDDVLAKMTSFWTAFQQLPDSIRTTARQAHQLEVVVPIGEVPPTTGMMDLPWLAAHYPPIAAALHAAGLTAEDHQRYRIALIVALMEQAFPSVADPITPGSVLARNLAFVERHKDELMPLQYRLRVWETP